MRVMSGWSVLIVISLVSAYYQQFLLYLTQQEQPKTQKVGIKTGKPICCCCPDTKLARDECMVQHGEEGCAALIEAHKQCLRAEGFDVK
jgi:cytochrome c oxidase assembly protein subunit 17